MADIALATAGEVEVVETFESISVKAAEAITAGAPVAIVPASGDAVNADANGADHLATLAGIATRTVAAGQQVTLMKRGILDGFTFDDQDWFEEIYVSDTVGRLADAAGTASLSVGRVVPGNAHPPITVAHDKLLYVDISYLTDIDTDT